MPRCMSLVMGWPGRAQRHKTTVEQDGEASKLKELTMHTHQQSSDPVATVGLDIGKNTFHLVGLDKRGAIVLRIKVSCSQLVRRLVNLPVCLIGLEAGSGSHHVARHAVVALLVVDWQERLAMRSFRAVPLAD